MPPEMLMIHHQTLEDNAGYNPNIGYGRATR